MSQTASADQPSPGERHDDVDNGIASTPTPPYTAVIFTSRRNADDEGAAYIIEDSGRGHSDPEGYRDYRSPREQPITIEGSKTTGGSKPRLLEQQLNLEHNEKDLISRSLNKHLDNLRP